MKIRILCVGRQAKGWVADAERDYIDRIKAFAQAAVEYVPPEDEHKLGAERACVVESEKLLARVRTEEIVIACDRHGRAFDSVQFADLIQTYDAHGYHLCIIIGGSHGISDAIRTRAQHIISFSRMTLPHELFRIVLTEQLYRAFTIMKGKPYHK